MTEILHIAGYRPVVDTVVEQQRLLGVEARVYATRELNAVSGLSVAQLEEIVERETLTDGILHLHDPSPFFCSSAEELKRLESLLKQTSARGLRLVLSLDGDVFWPQSAGPAGPAGALLRDHVACVFLGSAEWQPLINHLDNWSWMPTPYDTTKVAAPETYDPAKDRTRVLHLSFNSSVQESRRISELMHRLSESDKRFEITVHPVQDFTSIDDLRSVLRWHDVIVERISRPMYGWVALEGMAHGKTVLSGIHPQHREEWQQLEFSPVLDSNEENLAGRLTSLAVEPRSMRDIGKRSRKYVEDYHNARQIVKMMLEIYGQL